MWLNEIYSTVSIGKKSDKFYFQNGPTEEDALSTLLYIRASEYVIRRVQENQKGLKMNGTRQLLACDGDVNITNSGIPEPATSLSSSNSVLSIAPT
jgi:hypothetical protein